MSKDTISLGVINKKNENKIPVFFVYDNSSPRSTMKVEEDVYLYLNFCPKRSVVREVMLFKLQISRTVVP